MSMNVVHSGNTFQIYGDALKTYTQLPLGTYEVCFQKMTGFFLTSREDLIVNEDKIYGPTPEKVIKVLRGFEMTNRNFGVILSGKKGIGKSLFARQLGISAKDYNLPMLIVSSYYPGIADFLSSIDQEVIVFFDEFEKTFADVEHVSPQEEMLSLFDGVDNGKKLFIITCNEVNKLNPYFINRPGRFHYHFILKNPSADEIRDYLTDKLNPEYHNIIEKVISFSLMTDLTYDILRAIAFEINCGYDLDETLSDLNISKEGNPRYNICIEYADGYTRKVQGVHFDPYGEKTHIWINGANSTDCSIRYSFFASDIVADMATGTMTIDVNKLEVYVEEEYCDTEEEKAHYQYLCNNKIVKATFERCVKSDNLKFFV